MKYNNLRHFKKVDVHPICGRSKLSNIKGLQVVHSSALIGEGAFADAPPHLGAWECRK